LPHSPGLDQSTLLRIIKKLQPAEARKTQPYFLPNPSLNVIPSIFATVSQHPRLCFSFIGFFSFAGWPDVDAYYAGSSSAKRIPNVAIPLLCIQALDDPIAPKEAIPYEALKSNPNCVLVTTPCGGHLGWASGPGAPFGSPWTDAAVMEWLGAAHDELGKRGRGGRGKGAVGKGVRVGADSRVEMEVAAGAVAGESVAWARSMVEASAAGAAAGAAAVVGSEEVGTSGGEDEEGQEAAVVAGVQRGRGVVGFISLAAADDDAGVLSGASTSGRREGCVEYGGAGGVRGLGLEEVLKDPRLEAELAAAVDASVQAAVRAVLMGKLRQQQEHVQSSSVAEFGGSVAASASDGEAEAGAQEQEQQGEGPAEEQHEAVACADGIGGSVTSTELQSSGELKAAVFGAHLRWAL
jgi:hypothetical protein